MATYPTKLARVIANSKPNKKGCWIWRGKIAGGRLKYGYINITGGSMGAHRYAYQAVHGPIPASQEIRHSCHEPLCVNPDHLSLGTRKQNMADRTAADRKGNKITPSDVKAIRADPRTQEAIGKDYGINQSMVSKIKLRQSWPGVK